ncbi:MAG: phage tail tape measure protein [Bdellovibrionales bacterium]
MGEAVGALHVDFSTNVAGLISDMGRARKAVNDNVTGMNSSFQKFNKAQGNVLEQIGMLRAGITGLATGAFAIGARQAIMYADHIAETASSLGLLASTYQELAYAAKLGGVEQDAFDKVMLKFNQSISQNAKGFQRLGISVRDQNGELKDAKTLFDEVSDKVKNLGSAAQRADIVKNLFGKASPQFISFIAQGSEAIGQLQQKARDLGIVLDDALVKRAAEAADEMDTLGSVLKIGMYNVLLPLLPLVKAFGAILTSWPVRAVVEGIALMVDALVRMGSITVLLINDMHKLFSWEGRNQLSLDILKIAEGFGGFGKSAADATAPVKGLTDALSEEDLKIVQSTKSLALKNRQLQEMMRLYSEAPADLNSFKDVIDADSEAMEKNIDVSTRLGKAWLDAKLKNAELERSVTQVQQLYQQTLTPLEAYENTQRDLNTLLANGYISQDLYNRGMEQAADNFMSASANAKGLQGAVGGVGGAFKGWLGEAITETDNLSDSFKALGQQIIKVLAQKLIVDQVSNSIGSIFTQVGGSLLGSFGGFRANGGPTAPGKSYLVGERGPEWWTPGMSGNVTPMAGGGGNTYQIYAPGATEQTVRDLKALLMEWAGPGQVERRIADAQRRGKKG